MASIFRTGGNSANPKPPLAALRIQSSQQGKPKPIVWGTTRIAGDIIDYVDFFSVAASSSPGAGGKGGGPSSQPTTYNYYVSIDMGLCEGPIAGIIRYWNGKGVALASAPPPGTFIGVLVAAKFVSSFTIFTGSYSQGAWGYMASKHPERALNYRGLAHVACAGFPLGTSSELPNFSWEIQSTFTGYGSNGLDANPRDVVVDALTNVNYGAGFPVARLDTAMTQFSNYCIAAGLVISPALVEQRELSAFLIDIFAATNTGSRWTNGKLTAVPWGDTAITANGVTYTPDVTPLYDVTYDDLLPNQGSAGSGSGTSGAPIIFVRKRKSDAINDIKIEFLDRSNNYDPNATAEGKDESSIIAFGNRSSLRQLHLFCDANAAHMSAALQLAREQISGSYVFTLGPSFILVDVEDILTLTSPVMGLLRQGVRVTDIQENADGSLTFTAEEFLGTAAAPLYGRQAPLGASVDYNADPGLINAPAFFEPPDQLGGGLTVWAGLSGVNLALWGGCNIFASYDGVNYIYAGIVHGPSRMGVLAAALASFTPPPAGLTIDQIDTLHVDLTQSGAALASGSQLDANALNTLCYVDGEYISYQTAALTASSRYDLSYLVRGAYGSTIAPHAKGSPFVRLDQGVFKLPYTADRVGSTVYLKFCSFNLYGGGLQSLGAVSPFTYKLTGAALSSPLPNVANLRAVFVGSVLQLLWDEIADFRPVQYQISKGTTFAGAQILRVVAHPPFATQGDGTYWVTGISQPTAGLTVQSTTPQSLSVATSGSTLVDNVIATWDEAATGWGGSFTGGAVTDSIVIRTGSNGNFLGLSDFLGNTDFLNAGGAGQASGTYTIPDTHIIKLTSAVACKVTITWSAIGQAVSANFLGLADFLGKVDFLDYGLTSRVNVYPQIRVAQGIGVGFLSRTDFLGTSDFLNAGSYGFGPWQKYETGYYVGLAFQAQMVLTTNDSAVIAEATAMTFSVDVPDRVDTYNLTLGAAASSVTFQPEGAASPAAFNGGPGSSAVPIVSSEIVYAGAPVDGDKVVISALTLSGLTVAVRNAGANVARNVHLTVQGF